MAGLASLEEFCEARSQVELADHLVLTKADGADPDSLARLKIETLRLNGVARWHEAHEKDFPSRFLAALRDSPQLAAPARAPPSLTQGSLSRYASGKFSKTSSN